MNEYNRKGFTLVEIMIVVIVIGVLAVLSIPAFKQVQKTSLKNEVLNDLRIIAGTADQYFLDTGKTSVAVSSLDVYLHHAPATSSADSNLVYPTTAAIGTPLVVTGVELPDGSVSIAF